MKHAIQVRCQYQTTENVGYALRMTVEHASTEWHHTAQYNLGKQYYVEISPYFTAADNSRWSAATGPWVSTDSIDVNRISGLINPLTPNDHYSGRTAPLTSKHSILYIYSTNIGTEYCKHGINSPFFPLQNAVCFIILTYLVPVLFTFYIQGVLKLKQIIPAPKG